MLASGAQKLVPARSEVNHQQSPECCLKRPPYDRVDVWQRTRSHEREQVSLKTIKLIVVDNVRSTVFKDMKELSVLLLCGSVQLTNLPLSELSQVTQTALGEIKYAKVSSWLETLRKRLGWS